MGGGAIVRVWGRECTNGKVQVNSRMYIVWDQVKAGASNLTN